MIRSAMRFPFPRGVRPGPGWVLTLGFLLMFSIYEGGRVLHTRPAPCHLWRQTDCLSLTENYRSGRPFLEPEIHARIADGGTTGNSAGEFPLVYWAIGQVWKVTGPSDSAMSTSARAFASTGRRAQTASRVTIDRLS